MGREWVSAGWAVGARGERCRSAGRSVVPSDAELQRDLARVGQSVGRSVLLLTPNCNVTSRESVGRLRRSVDLGRICRSVDRSLLVFGRSVDLTILMMPNSEYTSRDSVGRLVDRLARRTATSPHDIRPIGRAK